MTISIGRIEVGHESHVQRQTRLRGGKRLLPISDAFHGVETSTDSGARDVLEK